MAPTQTVPAPINGLDVFVKGTVTEIAGDRWRCPEGYSRMTTGVSNKEDCDTMALALYQAWEANGGMKVNYPYARPEHDDQWDNGCFVYEYTSATDGACSTVYWNTAQTEMNRFRASKVACQLTST